MFGQERDDDPIHNRFLRVLLVAAGLCVLISAVSAASVSVAAKDSSTVSKTGASFVCDSVSDQVEVQRALTQIAGTGGTVFLSEGTFTFNDYGIRVPAGVVLQGKGSGVTRVHFTARGQIDLSGSGAVLQGLKVTGSGLVFIEASHTRVQDVILTTTGARWTSFGVQGPAGTSIEDIEFRDCAAIDCETSGWMFNSAVPHVDTIRNVRLINCRAINCGVSARPNPWSVGFDLSENANIDGMLVENCYAAGNWEAGFHFEQAPTIRGVVLRNCVSENNGRSPTAEWGAGYVVGEGTRIENSRSSNNKYGYFIHDPGFVASGCTDTGSRTSFWFPWSLRTTGSQLVDCASTGALTYALNIENQDQIAVTNFIVDRSASTTPVRVVACTNTVVDWRFATAVPTVTTPVTTSVTTQTPTPIGMASIRFTSNPTGASIYIDGRYAGTTPATISGITLGTHTFEMRKTGYRTWSQIVTVTAGFADQIMSYNPILSPNPDLSASIRLTGNPTGASIYIDGRYAGTTPATISGITLGTHTFEMRKTGYRTWSQTVAVTEGFVTATYPYTYNPTLIWA